MTCQHCGARTNLHLCHPCTTDLRAMLLDLIIGPETRNNHSHPGLLEHLQDAAVGNTRYTDPEHHHNGHTRTPPINPKAVKLQDDIHALMVRIAPWLPFCAINTAHMGASTAELALRAARHVQAIARHPEAGQTYHQLAHLTGRILVVIDRPTPRQKIPCLCGAELHPPADARTVVCDRCGLIAPIEDLERDHMRAAISAGATFTRQDLPVALAIAGTPASPRTLRYWRAHNRLPVAGYTPDGEPVYRPADLHQINKPT